MLCIAVLHNIVQLDGSMTKQNHVLHLFVGCDSLWVIH